MDQCGSPSEEHQRFRDIEQIKPEEAGSLAAANSAPFPDGTSSLLTTQKAHCGEEGRQEAKDTQVCILFAIRPHKPCLNSASS